MDNVRALEERIKKLEEDKIATIMTFNVDTNVLRSVQRALITTNIAIGSATPASCALLDLNSIRQGLVFSRMTTVQRDAIVSPVMGLVIYNTDTNTLNLYDGTDWVPVGGDPWIDYSLTSTVVGFASFTTQQIFIEQVAPNTYLVAFQLAGTSDDITVTFTLPFTSAAGLDTTVTGYGVDNGAMSVNPTMIELLASSSTVTVYRDLTQGGWTNSGTKEVRGQFFVRTD